MHFFANTYLNLWSLMLSQSVCKINLKALDTDQPFILNPTTLEKIYPQFGSDEILLTHGQLITLSCAGSKILDSQAQCISDPIFRWNNQKTTFSKIKCNGPIRSIIKYANQIPDKLKLIEVGFPVNSSHFNQIIEIWFDKSDFHTAYTLHYLTKHIESAPPNIQRLVWDKNIFYGTLDLNWLYQSINQQQTINSMLGLPRYSTQYINTRSRDYFIKGHLTPKTDFVYAAEQGATMYYVNAAPQWDYLNNGNWKALEIRVRKLAGVRGTGTDLLIATGTYGVLSALHNQTKNPTKLYLHYDVNSKIKKIPIPLLFWKLIFDPLTNAAVVIIGVNKPKFDQSGNHTICNDVSKKMIGFKIDATSGILYACNYSSFKSVVPNIPNLNVHILLDYLW